MPSLPLPCAPLLTSATRPWRASAGATATQVRSLSVKRMLALLEPVMILGLGLVIGGIILSILMAILKVNSLVG